MAELADSGAESSLLDAAVGAGPWIQSIGPSLGLTFCRMAELPSRGPPPCPSAGGVPRVVFRAQNPSYFKSSEKSHPSHSVIAAP